MASLNQSITNLDMIWNFKFAKKKIQSNYLSKKSLLVTKEGYRSEINTYFADDNITMTSGKQDNPPKDTNEGQLGNKRFRTIVQEMSNWEEAHRI